MILNIPINEADRLRSLNSFKILDTLPEDEYDEITRLASYICQCPIALITFMDKDRQWFKSKVGTDQSENVRNGAICSTIIVDPDQPLIVSDLSIDERFKDFPIVKSEPNVAFYAGMPLFDEEHYAIGTLCVLDVKPKTISDQQISALEFLSKCAMKLLAERKARLLKVEEEKELTEELNLIRYAVNNSSDNLLIIDPETMKFVGFNEQTMKVLEYSKEELLEMGPQDITFDFSKKGLAAEFKKVITAPGISAFTETKHRKKSGDVFDVEMHLNSIKYKDKGYLIVASVRDITKRNKDKESLIKSEHLLNEAQTMAKLGSWEWDLVNDKFEFSKELISVLEIDNKNERGNVNIISKLVLPEDIKTKANLGTSSALQYRIITPGGNIKHLEGKASQEMDPQGKILRILGTVQDITEIKNSEKEKENLIKELSDKINALQQYTYIVSHNLRAPLANILGITDMFENMHDNISDEELTFLLKGISDASNGMDNVIKDLNEIISLNNPLDLKELIDFASIYNSVKSLLDKQIKECGVEISYKLKSYNSFYSIKSYIQSIIYNLLSNSIKYRCTERDPCVEITIDVMKNSTVICVKDNGIGIDLDRYGSELFGLYKRFNFDVEGKGIGLHMIKTQIEALKGKIFVESKVGEGTSMTVRFDTTI